jgi:putative transposase
VTALCRRYHVTRAGFYAWRRRGVSAHAEQDRRLSRAIVRLFTAHQQRYGSPRIHRLLRSTGWIVSRRRVARLMREAGLVAKAVRGYRAKARIHRRYAQHPNRLWTTTVNTEPSVGR